MDDFQQRTLQRWAKKGSSKQRESAEADDEMRQKKAAESTKAEPEKKPARSKF
ncbi:MAG TPA: hypothetical protein VF610_11935 [Segetibacter sp.]